MKIGYYIKKDCLRADPRVLGVLAELRDGGVEVFDVRSSADLVPDMEMLLSFGGDGTFLCAARIVAEAGVPVLGVNLGRLGFLSENSPETVVGQILSGACKVEEREMLLMTSSCSGHEAIWPYAVNEISFHRTGPATLGIEVRLNGTKLPTYWADGMLVATSSGSTAYSLSAGGPICTPDTKVFIIAPIAPHNLNLRPLVVPADSVVEMTLRSRDGVSTLSLDNRAYQIHDGESVRICAAPFSLRKVTLGGNNFIQALESRFFWGQDVRNSYDK